MIYTLKVKSLLCLSLLLISSLIISKTIESNTMETLKNIARTTVLSVDEILSYIEENNGIALSDFDHCENLQLKMKDDRKIYETLLVKDNIVTCSSKLGKINLPLEQFATIETFDNLSLGMVNASKYQSIFLTTFLKSRPHERVISILDKDYSRGKLGYNNDIRIKYSSINVNGLVLTKKRESPPKNIIVEISSSYFPFSISMEASNLLINKERAELLKFILPIILVSIIIIFYFNKENYLYVKLLVAMKLRHLDVFYQPQLDLTNRRIIGYEALIRWKQGEHFISPDSFIPIAEKRNLCVPIAKFVLERSLSHFSTLELKQTLHLGINLPAGSLMDPATVKILQKYNKLFHKRNVQLGIEITERELITPNLSKYTKALQLIGIEVLIDDFGVGQTSLSILQHLQFDYIKIDKCFINNIIESPVNQSVLEAFIKLAQGSESKLIAEGVETQEQASFIRQKGITIQQGYLYFSPLTFEKISALTVDDIKNMLTSLSLYNATSTNAQ